MQIGAYSFGDTQFDEDGTQRNTAAAIKNLFDAIVHADTVGLDYFGIGEHHTVSMPASSPGAIMAAAAAATRQIVLGSAASIRPTAHMASDRWQPRLVGTSWTAGAADFIRHHRRRTAPIRAAREALSTGSRASWPPAYC